MIFHLKVPILWKFSAHYVLPVLDLERPFLIRNALCRVTLSCPRLVMYDIDI